MAERQAFDEYLADRNLRAARVVALFGALIVPSGVVLGIGSRIATESDGCFFSAVSAAAVAGSVPVGLPLGRCKATHVPARSRARPCHGRRHRGHGRGTGRVFVPIDTHRRQDWQCRSSRLRGHLLLAGARDHGGVCRRDFRVAACRPWLMRPRIESGPLAREQHLCARRRGRDRRRVEQQSLECRQTRALSAIGAPGRARSPEGARPREEPVLRQRLARAPHTVDAHSGAARRAPRTRPPVSPTTANS